MSTNGPTVYLPNLQTITSTVSGLLPINHNISQQAKLTHIFDELHSASLLSLGQLCDDGCKILLDKQYTHVFKNNALVLKGYRNFSDGLWDVPLPQSTQKLFHIHHEISNKNELVISYPTSSIFHSLNVIIRRDKTKSDLVRYLHACCFSPPIETFLQAVKKGNFVTWPGLTEKLVLRYLEPTVATAKGHLN